MTRTVLVVDDERDLALTCERLLRRLGWSVVITGSREAALTILGRDPRPVLVIVDRQLPDGDGIEVLREARSRAVPVVMVTGYGSAATRRLALEEGAAGFLAKPFAASEMLGLVRSILGDAPPGARAPGATPAPDVPRPSARC